MLAGSIPATGWADVPFPARLTQPATPAEAWNVIRLALENADHLFEEGRVGEVTDQAVLLGPSLRLLAREGALADRQAEAGAIAGEAFGLVNLLVRESMLGNLDGARTLMERLRSEVKDLAQSFESTLPSAEIFSCVDHPEEAAPDGAEPCPECGKALRPRRFPYSAIHTGREAPALRLSWREGPPLEAGRKWDLVFRLATEDGEAATESDLVLAHSRRVHLLLLSETGDDFRHLAPEPANEPGTYQISFVPSSSASYRAWILVIPGATRSTEAHPLRIPGRLESASAAAPPLGELASTSDGLAARLVFPGPGPARLKARSTQTIRVHFSEPGGAPLQRLEPIWNAFAHLSLVSEDFATAAQVHPIGGELQSETLRGGPDLAFKIHPPEPGIWWLFVQIRLDGRDRTFPFRLEAGK